MRNILALSLATSVSVLALAACSSDAGPKDQSDFDHGTVGAAGSSGGEVSLTEPNFVAKPYPAAPYGTQIGSVIAPYEFLGWKDGSVSNYDTNAFENLTLADYYDPTGEKGVKYIMLNSSAVWCTVCRAEYKYINDAGLYDTYKAKGVEFMGAIFEDGANPPNPAAPKDPRLVGLELQREVPDALGSRLQDRRLLHGGRHADEPPGGHQGHAHRGQSAGRRPAEDARFGGQPAVRRLT